ncbi:CaiB/BaiF CoA transferase family protein [Chloroflexota bacterium]
MAKPLEEIKILELTLALSAPFGIMILCDLGAEVIKVEKVDGGDISRQNAPIINGVSLYFYSINRGKKSVALNLKTPEGKALFLDLVKQADVVVENFVPGTMDRLGLGYEILRKQNPRLIYAACSGFGQTGPYHEKPAVDIIVQGMGGIMSITGEEDGPPVRPGASLGDIAAGLFLSIGILSALIERDRSGKGQMIDVSMLDCQVAILENAFIRYLNTGEVPQRIGTRHPLVTPFQAFQTKDGYIVVSAAGKIDQWALFTEMIGRPHLLSDERFEDRTSRTKHHKVLEPILAEALQEKTTNEWLSIFESIGIPCGPLNTIPETAADPQVLHRDMFVAVPDNRLGEVKICNTPIKLSRTPANVEHGAPDLGEHTRKVLSEWLGLQIAQLKSFEDKKVIGSSVET